MSAGEAKPVKFQSRCFLDSDKGSPCAVVVDLDLESNFLVGHMRVSDYNDCARLEFTCSNHREIQARRAKLQKLRDACDLIESALDAFEEQRDLAKGAKSA